VAQERRLLDEPAVILLEEAVAVGIRMHDLAPLLGVPPKLLASWLKQGEAEAGEGKHTLFADVWRRVERARVERVRTCLARVHAAGKGVQTREVETTKDAAGNVLRVRTRVSERPELAADLWLLEHVDGYVRPTEPAGGSAPGTVAVTFVPLAKPPEGAGAG
jgi:hypothetical protein